MKDNVILMEIDKPLYETIHSVQYDRNSRFVHVKLLNNSLPFDLTNKRVILSGSKPDGEEVFNTCKIAEDLIVIEITEEMNAIPGVSEYSLEIYGGDMSLLQTKNFKIKVTPSVRSKKVESRSEVKALTDALLEVQNIDNRFAKTNAKLSEVANKGTTVEVIERVTKEEIDRQIASGTMANLTIADKSIEGGKIKDETITKDKLEPYIKFGIENLDDDVIIPVGNSKAKVNLYKSGTGEPGWIESKTGIVRSNTRDWTSDFIACKPGQTLTKADDSSNTINDQDICFFAKDKTYLSGLILSKNDNWKNIKVPSNAYFFRFDMLATHKDTEKIYGDGENNTVTGYMLNDNIKIGNENLVNLEVDIDQLSDNVLTKTVVYPDSDEEGEGIVEYSLNENIKVTGDNITDLQVGINQLSDDIIVKTSALSVNTKAKVNLYKSGTGEPGWIESKTGIVRSNTRDWTSDFIACKPGQTLTKADDSSNTINDQDICFFAKDKTYLSGLILSKNDNWKNIKVPSNAYFFRFDMLATHKDTEKIYGDGSGSDDNEIGSYQYYLSDEIKIQKSNIIGMEDDDSTKEQISLYSEDGVKYLLTIDADGQLNVRPATPNLPSNFNRFTAAGKSCMKGDILVAPHTDDQNLGWLIVLDSNLSIKKYKQISSFAYNFRKHRNSAGEIRYIYAQTVNKEHPKMAMNGGYDNTKLVVADENLETLHEYKLKARGTVSEGHPGENHEIIYFDDNHYMLLAYVASVVSNIPDKSGSYKALNCVIQEVKDGKVVFHWESIDHPELYQYACFNKDFTKFPSTQNTHNDYHHMNGFVVDPTNNNHLLVSSRHLGLMKIEKSTGNILWMFGRGGRIDFKNMTQAQTPYLQHHITRLNDGSIICFDNSGAATNNVRICRYWLDEVTMTLTQFKEYITQHPRSPFMGSVDMVKEGVFLINYGGAYKGVTFEEYDFNLNQQNCSFKFNDGTDCYRVWKDIKR